MKSQVNKVWNLSSSQQLAISLVEIDDVSKMRNFLRDVMTEKEITEISMRLVAAQMLKDGIKYSQITKNTNLSSRTVARISDWMKNGCGGYEAVLKQLKKRSHILPASAE